jgi:hypothetical protein
MAGRDTCPTVILMHHRNIPPRDIPQAQANVSVDYSECIELSPGIQPHPAQFDQSTHPAIWLLDVQIAVEFGEQ